MAKLVDFYNIRPQEIEVGNVMASTVTCHIGHIDVETCTAYIRCYRGKYPADVSDEYIPQGSPLVNDSVAVARILFPVLNAFENVEFL
ncbi:hypothetical protein LCGC14_0923670 [marine sediment metagenome]|uniref:Uncharacterized protein n=1 Tax=marine sediment metagenome TaxID=412755 RepID=A0A0F9PAP2_9ZZZZ